MDREQERRIAGDARRSRLSDVAARAKVSKSIASRILNGYPDLNVRGDTRARVLKAADELDYSPHAGALAVSGARTGAFAFLVPPLTSPVYVRILRGAFAEALRHDVVVLLVEDIDPKQATDSVLRLVRSGRVDGVIMASATSRHPLVRQLRDSPFPHVFVNRAVAGSGRNVVMDDALASTLAWRHLTELGHQNIGMVAGLRQIEPARRRERAFLRAAGRTAATLPVENVEFTEAGGADAFVALLDKQPNLTAVYTSSLSQAVGVLGAAARAGFRVAEDLSVIAYDDLPIAEFVTPPLTTVRMPLGELGAMAVTAIMGQLDGGTSGDRTVETSPQVVVRQSTAPPPS